MNTLRVVSVLSPFGSVTPLPDVAHALWLMMNQLAADMKRTGVRLEIDQRISGEVFNAARVFGPLLPTNNPRPLLVLPPHQASALASTASALTGSAAVIMGINGGEEAVSGNPNAFNIGIHVPALRQAALQRILKHHGYVKPALHISDAPCEGAITLESSRAELVKSVRGHVDGAIVLSVAGVNGSDAIAILEEAGFRGILIRDKGTSFPAIGAFEVVDLVGNFVDLPTTELRSLIQRAIGPIPDGDPLLRDLMSVAWRLDAIQICASAMSLDASSLPRALTRFRTGGEVFQALTRRISFTPARVNAHRSIAIVRHGLAGGRPCLHPLQIDGHGRDSVVAFTSCKALWIGDVDPATGTFAVDFELDVSSAASIGVEDVLFVNASEPPEVTQGVLQDTQDDSSKGHFHLHARVRGSFRFDPQVSDYPFDLQRLPLLIEIRFGSRTRPVQPIALASAKSPRIEGWDIESTELGRSLACRPVPDGPDSVIWIDSESAVFTITVRRRLRDALTRTAIPLVLILLLVWATGFWDDGSASAEVLANGFLACVALYLAEPKPAPGRTTFIDRLFLVCNIVVGLKLVLLVGTFGLADPTSGLRLINRVSLFALPIIMAATLLTIWPRNRGNREWARTTIAEKQPL